MVALIKLIKGDIKGCQEQWVDGTYKVTAGSTLARVGLSEKLGWLPLIMNEP